MKPVISSLLEARSLNNPLIPISNSSLMEYLDGSPTDSGVSVNERTALTISAVYRAVSLISGSIAGLPLQVRRVGSFERVVVPLLDSPSPTHTDFEFWELVSTHLLLWGNAFIEKISNELNQVIELRPISPWRVAVRPVPATGGDRVGREYLIDGSKRRTAEQIVHIPGMGYDGLVGLSVIQCAKQGLGVGLAAEKSAALLFGSGSMVSGILSTDQSLDDSQAERLKARWQKKVSGVGRAHEIAVMGSGLKFESVTMPFKDAQFLESRQFQTTEIARWFGLPPWMIADVEKSTSWGTGIEQQGIAYVRYTLYPWLRRIEKRITRDIIQDEGKYAKFLVDGLMRADTKARYEAYAIGIQGGWLSPNMVLAKEDEPPIDGGDLFLRPMNMMPITEMPMDQAEEGQSNE